jgi:hypothetical protein
MKQLIAILISLSFAAGAFAASHAGAAPMGKDAPKVDCKDAKNKDDKACKAAAEAAKKAAPAEKK